MLNFLVVGRMAKLRHKSTFSTSKLEVRLASLPLLRPSLDIGYIPIAEPLLLDSLIAVIPEAKSFHSE